MIPLFKPFIPPKEELFSAWAKVLDSGYIAEGDTVREFERQFGKYIGSPYVAATNSCTSALHIALILSGAKPGTEVISTPMTAVPTNMAIAHTGAKIIWADVNPLNGNIDWGNAISKITDKTVAIMCVHYGGIPCYDDDYMSDVSYEVSIIADCAHALGADAGWDNGIVSVADFHCFSFQAIKFATTGDGGALSCSTGEDDYAARRLRWFGIDRKVPRTEMDIVDVGYKYNMNNLTAAMGLVQLRSLARQSALHNVNGRYFDEVFAKVPGIRPAEIPDGSKPSYWLYTLLADIKQDRDDLSRKLTEAGIGNGLVHRRNDFHTVFAGSKCDLPGLDYFWDHMLHIPCGWWLTEKDREHIMEIVRAG